MKNIFYENKYIESIDFNVREQVIYLLVKNEVYKNESIISSTNERITIPIGIDLDFLREIDNSKIAIDLINHYWSLI